MAPEQELAALTGIQDMNRPSRTRRIVKMTGVALFWLIANTNCSTKPGVQETFRPATLPMEELSLERARELATSRAELELSQVKFRGNNAPYKLGDYRIQYSRESFPQSERPVLRANYVLDYEKVDRRLQVEGKDSPLTIAFHGFPSSFDIYVFLDNGEIYVWRGM